MQKSVFITGVNGGIGQALAETFKNASYFVYGTDMGAQECHACDTYFDIDLDRFVADSAYQREQERLIMLSVTSLNVLINNAAVQILDSLSDINKADWQSSLNVNLSAPLYLSQLFFDLLKREKGSILNIGSIHQDLSKKSFISYASSKAALAGLTKAMALDSGADIRVNGIKPAAISTEMLKAGFEKNPDKLKELESYHPTNNIGDPNDVARLALFISDDANKFLNGSLISLDGGISSSLHDPEQ